jgi:transcriptional regulator with GAF, ATPase, and Fis domain
MVLAGRNNVEGMCPLEQACESLIGASVALQAVEEEIGYAARCDAKVLITGDSGVGKELVARRIHGDSVRKKAAFVAINCAGVPDSLLESELFGHVRGSFTDAYRDKAGLLEAAHQGTVFLDEIGEMSQRMQAVLLRFLETGEIQRVGSDRRLARVDTRIIAATNRDLGAQIAAGAFRSDLYYRINVIHIFVPPLRQRREDVPLLLNHFLRMYAKRYGVAEPVINADTLELLVGYSWPGNVRELKNVVERLAVRGNLGSVGPTDLPPEIATMARRAVSAETRVGQKAIADAPF